jgi:hypothetical protein
MFAMYVGRRAIRLVLPRACVRDSGSFGSSPRGVAATTVLAATVATVARPWPAAAAATAAATTAASLPRKSTRAVGGGGGGSRAAAATTATESSSPGFLDLGISAELLDDARDVLAAFRNRPTEVQCASIPRMLAGENLIIGSETGSGKTLAYTLPLFDMLQAEDRLNGRCVPHRPRAVVVLPSRELGLQVRALARSRDVVGAAHRQRRARCF